MRSFAIQYVARLTMGNMDEASRFEDLPPGGRFSRQEMISGWSQDRLSAARILVVGAGAIGNETLKNLALLGVGTVGIIDLDRVEESNLSRCVLFRAKDIGCLKAEVASEMLRQLHPSIHIQTYPCDLLTGIGAGVVEEYDLVLGCLDSIEARWQLNKLARQAGVSWIDAGVNSFHGQIALYHPEEGACYECGLSDNMLAYINERHSCSGAPRETAPAAVPVAATIVSLTASLQVHEAVRYLISDAKDTGHWPGLAPGERLSLSLAPYELFVVRSRINPLCMAHGERYEKKEPLGMGYRNTVSDVLQAVGCNLMELDWDIVTGLRCDHCGTQEVVFPLWQLAPEHQRCLRCGAACFAERTSRIEVRDAVALLPLETFGVPPGAYIRTSGDQGEFLIKLDASYGS